MSMKALAAAVVFLALCTGAASGSVHRNASLRPLKLTPPVFRGSGFQPNERVNVTLRGAAVPAAHVLTDANGQFRARLGAVSGCKAWKVLAVGADGASAGYQHARCAGLIKDVEGVVRRSPTKNICSEEESCSAPAPGVTVQAWESGGLVAQTTTDANGQFSFSLANSEYTVKALGRGAQPQTIAVQTSSPVHLSFMVDTGIR